MNDHGNKKREWTACQQLKRKSRYVLKASLENILTNGWSFVGSGQAKRPCIPLLVKLKWGVLKAPFGTGVDRHTHTHIHTIRELVRGRGGLSSPLRSGKYLFIQLTRTVAGFAKVTGTRGALS